MSAPLTAAQKKAIAGVNDYTTCVSWDQTFASRSTATDSCNAAIPVSARWDPVTNPGGVKCNSNEQFVNQLGRDLFLRLLYGAQTSLEVALLATIGSVGLGVLMGLISEQIAAYRFERRD